jgi:hypothetical protein
MPAADVANNRADCTKEIFQGLFDDGFQNRRDRIEGAAMDFIIQEKGGSEIFLLHLFGFDDFDANTVFYFWVIVAYFYS